MSRMHRMSSSAVLRAAAPVVSAKRMVGNRVPRRVEVDHALSPPLLRSQCSPSHARRFAGWRRAVQVRGGSAIFDPLTGRLPWPCWFDECRGRTPGYLSGAPLEGPFHKRMALLLALMGVEVYSKKCHYQSGRPDWNRRPLDPSHVQCVAGRGSVGT